MCQKTDWFKVKCYYQKSDKPFKFYSDQKIGVAVKFITTDATPL